RGTAFKAGDKPGTGEQVRVSMDKVVEYGASIFGTVPFRFKEIIQQMVELTLVQIDVQQTGTGIKFRPAEIVSAAEKVEKSLGDLLEKRLTSELDLVDVDQLSTLTGVDADKTWKKLVAGQLPKELVLIRKQAALDLIATQGTAAFERRAFKRPEEFTTLDDLEFIDDEILRTAFTKIDSLDQGALLKVAPAALRGRLAGTLSPRMKEIVEKAAAALAHVDEPRARRLESRLVDLVKQTAAEAR
ncbi:MAG: hypothetical protein RL199_492, partial [Pseudomonadota bacterium]